MHGAEFYLLRRLMGMSQDEMAATLQVRRDSVRDYETGKLVIPPGVEWEVRELADSHTAAVYAMQADVDNGLTIKVRRANRWQTGICMRVLDRNPDARVQWL